MQIIYFYLIFFIYIFIMFTISLMCMFYNRLAIPRSYIYLYIATCRMLDKILRLRRKLLMKLNACGKILK